MDKWDLFLDSIRSSGIEASAADMAALTRLLRGPKGDRGMPGREGPAGPPADAALLARIAAVEEAVSALRVIAPAGLPPEQLARLAALEAALTTRRTAAPATIISKGVTILAPQAGAILPAWRAPFPCRLVAVRGHTMDAGGLPTVNCARNGVALHLQAGLMLTKGNTWQPGEGLQNVDYAAGDTLDFRVVSLRYHTDDVSIQADFEAIQ